MREGKRGNSNSNKHKMEGVRRRGGKPNRGGGKFNRGTATVGGSRGRGGRGGRGGGRGGATASGTPAGGTATTANLTTAKPASGGGDAPGPRGPRVRAGAAVEMSATNQDLVHSLLINLQVPLVFVFI